ncbi:MAG: malonyl-CoA decarboxylase [Pseudomonadota bacterium]
MSGSLLSDMLARISETGRALIGGDEPAPLIERAEALLRADGEATGTARARAILDDYAALDRDGRAAFLAQMAERFATDTAALDAAIAAYQDAPGPDTARALHIVSEPRSQELLRLMNRAPGGTEALVRMREDLLAAMRADPGLAGLDGDFRHLFSSWFNRGFLELRRVDWQTPAAILEKIIQYEAVHAIQDWSDLRRRVGAPDRQLYGFFHPALSDEPLIFVEVALTAEIPGAIGPILAGERATLDPANATTAVFYSISNCQIGLRGISFGSFLIKQVVEELRRDFPRLSTFVTLSPVPGFAAWLAGAGVDVDTLGRGRVVPVAAIGAGLEGGAGIPGDGVELPDRARVQAARAEALSALAAHYLTAVKRPDGGPMNPVARFHLGNGARLERINPDADASPRGQAESHGVMVNYLYALDDIERNHEAYAARFEIAQSSAVRRLARNAPLPA